MRRIKLSGLLIRMNKLLYKASSNPSSGPTLDLAGFIQTLWTYFRGCWRYSPMSSDIASKSNTVYRRHGSL